MVFWIALALGSSLAHASPIGLEPDWSEGFTVPDGGRGNPYAVPAGEWSRVFATGRLHTLHYPVDVTGMLIPFRPLQSIVEGEDSNPLRRWMVALFRDFSGTHSMDDVYNRAGLNTYPITTDPVTSVYHVPRDRAAEGRMGATQIRARNGAVGFTFSCAACHTAELFGKRVIGMSNRFPRANEFFREGLQGVRLLTPAFFQATTDATAPEVEMYTRTREAVRYVSVKSPLALGLDTSLSQVALSMAHRGLDPFAARDPQYAKKPRPDRLDNNPADSKPSVWWNLKYKNRWLSDGSIVSGNPIYTNILWNEIGRGVDLHILDEWLGKNSDVIAELSTAVFGSEAPRYTDFFEAARIDETRARRGQMLFDVNCAQCHGTYQKQWDVPGSESLPWADRMKTVQVDYPKQTAVKDVGTDAFRWRGMESLARSLNPLEISRRNGIVIRPQKGYVPPPLVGIWARWPYFHNNSAPSLCAVLTAGKSRPKSYWAGEARNQTLDFDDECIGYPSGRAVPRQWKESPEQWYDGRKAGLSNLGHDEGIFLEAGRELLSPGNKRDLIQFLKTL